MNMEEKLNQSEVHFQIIALKDETIEDLKLQFLAFATKLFESYIWNSEPITVSIQNGLLHGSLEFGDLYDEEWLIVKLLIGMF